MGAMAPYLAMAGIQAGGAILSAMFANEDTEIQGFDGDLHPTKAMLNTRSMIDNLSRMATGYANAPVSLPSSTVQGLPTFTGGGLPTPIGVTGKDPARANPKLLTLPGISDIAGKGDSPRPEVPPPPDNDGDGKPDWPKDFPPDYWQPPQQPQTLAGSSTAGTSPISGVARRPRTDLMMPGAMPGATPGVGDDSQQALAAVDLLMNGMFQGGQQPWQ